MAESRLIHIINHRNKIHTSAQNNVYENVQGGFGLKFEVDRESEPPRSSEGVRAWIER